MLDEYAFVDDRKGMDSKGYLDFWTAPHLLFSIALIISEREREREKRRDQSKFVGEGQQASKQARVNSKHGTNWWQVTSICFFGGMKNNMEILAEPNCLYPLWIDVTWYKHMYYPNIVHS